MTAQTFLKVREFCKMNGKSYFLPGSNYIEKRSDDVTRTVKSMGLVDISRENKTTHVHLLKINLLVQISDIMLR